jgi:hypothetical protein
VAVFTTNNPNASKSQQVSQSVTVAPGSHKLVVIGYQSTGGSVSSTETFTVTSTAACYPSSADAQICSPAKGAAVNSPVTVVAGATTCSGYISAIRIYVDNVARAIITDPQQSKSFAITQSISLAVGTHNLVIVAYPSTGGSLTSSESIIVN